MKIKYKKFMTENKSGIKSNLDLLDSYERKAIFTNNDFKVFNDCLNYLNDKYKKFKQMFNCNISVGVFIDMFN